MRKLVIFLALVSSVMAQDAKRYPHPFLELDGTLNGGGYSPLGASGTAGVDIEQTYVVSRIYGTYDLVRKSDDGTAGNAKGRQRTLASDAFFRMRSGLLLGGTFEWTKLNTTNYAKEHGLIGLGGGYDGSLRVQATFLDSIHEVVSYPNGSSCEAYYCSSGSKGFAVNLWYPSPARNRHWFLHESTETLVFHNYGTSDHSAGTWLNLGVIYRF
jgi:hypothetical protein